MRTFRIGLVLIVWAMGSATTLAQYGLYGAPAPISYEQFSPNAGAVHQAPAGAVQGGPMYGGTTPTTVGGPRSAADQAWLSQMMSPQLQTVSDTNIQGPLTPTPATGPATDPNLGIMYTGGACSPAIIGACGPTDSTRGIGGSECLIDTAPVFRHWYGSLKALMITRNKANRYWTTSDANDDSNQMMHTANNMAWRWGGEIRLGYRFMPCDPCAPTGLGLGSRLDRCAAPDRAWGIEAVYSTFEAFESTHSMTNPGGQVNTPMNLTHVFIGAAAIDTFFDGAGEHKLDRWNELHNIEINFVRSRFDMPVRCGTDVTWLIGARYFRFNERLVFGSVRDGFSFGEDLTQEAYINEWLDNNLLGGQIGADISTSWQAWNLRTTFSPRVGLFNNTINQDFRVYRGDGVGATQTGYASYSYPVRSSKNILSMLAELDLGLVWQPLENVGLKVGYKAIFISGIGLADDQLPFYLVDIPEIAAIESNSTLIIHGGYAGLEWAF